MQGLNLYVSYCHIMRAHRKDGEAFWWFFMYVQDARCDK